MNIKILFASVLYSYMVKSIFPFTISLNSEYSSSLVDRLQNMDPECTSERKQQMTFYEEPTFTGKSETFCSNQPDLQSTPGPGKDAKYFCIDRGVWVIGLELNGVPTTSGYLVSGNFGRICISFTEGFSVKYTSIRHLSSSNLDHSALSLYENIGHGGQWRGSELYVDGNEIRLQRPQEMSSFAITGLENYTIFTGTNFDGDSECLKPGKNNPSLTGVTFHDEIRLRNVGSIRKGCNSAVLESVIKENPAYFPVSPILNYYYSLKSPFVIIDGEQESGLFVVNQL